MNEEIQKWERIVKMNIHGPNHTTGIERLMSYLCSITMGREFMESCDAYIARTGRKEFCDWATNIVKHARAGRAA